MPGKRLTTPAASEGSSRESFAAAASSSSPRPSHERIDGLAIGGRECLAARVDGGEALFEIAARREVDREPVRLEAKRLLAGLDRSAIGEHPGEVGRLDSPVERRERRGV